LSIWYLILFNNLFENFNLCWRAYGEVRIEYEEMVKVLCFGWINGMTSTVDDQDS
jgi:hypothetical protein